MMAGDSQVFITAAGNLQLGLEAQGSGRAARHGADARTEMRLVGEEVFLDGLDAIMATRRAAIADSTAFHDLDCEDRVNFQTVEFRVLAANQSKERDKAGCQAESLGTYRCCMSKTSRTIALARSTLAASGVSTITTVGWVDGVSGELATLKTETKVQSSRASLSMARIES
jgi:hypothetical protein